MPNKNYKKGYALERYCELTLLYNGYHVKRNAMSIGIEDLIAFNYDKVLLIQCKNTKRGEKSMTKDEKEILRLHADELDAIPIYLYKDGRGKYIWQNVSNGWRVEEFDQYNKEWYRERMKERERLRKMKKKNLAEYNRYVLKNWDKVSKYIC